MAFTYFRVGRELWGQQSIGEVTRKQTEAINSKRKVSGKCTTSVISHRAIISTMKSFMDYLFKVEFSTLFHVVLWYKSISTSIPIEQKNKIVKGLRINEIYSRQCFMLVQYSNIKEKRNVCNNNSTFYSITVIMNIERCSMKFTTNIIEMTNDDIIQSIWTPQIWTLLNEISPEGEEFF